MQTSSFIFLFYLVISISLNNSTGNQDYINRLPEQEKELLQKSIARGKIIYNEFCVQCHLSNGKSTPGVTPPLDGADWLMEKRAASIRAVKHGLSGEIVVNGITYNKSMPAMGLTDHEVADVMNYILNSWGNKQNKMVTTEEVKSINE